MRKICAVYEHNKERFPQIDHNPFPVVAYYGSTNLYNLDSLDETEENSLKFSYYVMTLYKMNLNQYLSNVTGIAYMRDIFEVAYQLMNILKIVHCSKRTFNDLKPENIMITPPGSPDENLKVHLIDYGFVDKFFNYDTNEHIKEWETVENFRGNLFFSSIDQMNFMRTSARDDIKSVFYLILISLNPELFKLEQTAELDD